MVSIDMAEHVLKGNLALNTQYKIQNTHTVLALTLKRPLQAASSVHFSHHSAKSFTAGEAVAKSFSCAKVS